MPMMQYPGPFRSIPSLVLNASSVGAARTPNIDNEIQLDLDLVDDEFDVVGIETEPWLLCNSNYQLLSITRQHMSSH